MAIYISSIHPFMLLRYIKQKIEDRGIDTWEIKHRGDRNTVHFVEV